MPSFFRPPSPSKSFCTVCLGGIVATGLLAGFLWNHLQAGSDVTQADRDHGEVTDLMHAKWSATELVLLGLVQRDMNLVHRGGHELVLLAKSAAWLDATSDPVYTHFNAEFQRFSERVVRMAVGNNPDGAAFAYQNLTTTCIHCHEHVRDVTRLSTARD